MSQDFKSTREKVLNGETTLPEVVENYLSEIEKTNNDVNAFISVYPDEALEKAKAIQQKIETGKAGKLAGAVFGIKDLIVENGRISSSASKMLQKYEGVYNATVIDKILAEDAISLGRLNMDEFGMGSSTENSVYEPTKNPLDLNKVPGGSSGGSAAAIAAGYCNITLGSDTGGSIRQPSAFCGTVGLKPTYGRVSRYGLIAYASSFDCIGPITSTVSDAAQTLEVIAGFDAKDGTTSTNPVPKYSSVIDSPNSKLKIGVPKEYFGEGLDSEIKKKIESHLALLEKNGATIIEIELPHTAYAVATYYILATAEASSNLARFDGVRYGHRTDTKLIREEMSQKTAEIRERIKKAGGSTDEIDQELKKIDSSLVTMYKKSRTEAFGPEVKRRIMLGTYVLSSGYYEAYYAKAQKIRRLIQNDFKSAFQEVDVVVSPTTPTTAFKIGSKLNDPVQMYLNDIYTISANLAGICGISVPIGSHSDGLPIGLQYMANAFNENTLIQAARLSEITAN